MGNLERYRHEVRIAVPRLVFGMSFIFVTVQGGLAALHLAGRFFRAQLKQSH
jgi:hypothetical protein